MSDLSALCLAKLRLDGFVSLDAETSGTLVTRPFMLGGGVLYVNADLERGELRAELLDAETMQPLPGYSAAECHPMTADELRGRVTWQNAARPRSTRPMRVRFEMSQARLYAFWLE